MIQTIQSMARIRSLLDFWGEELAESASDADALGKLAAVLDADASASKAWEAMVSLLVSLPTRGEVQGFRRSIRLNGARAAIEQLGSPLLLTPFGERHHTLTVANAVLVDVFGTASSSRTTGIQRVVREVVSRWVKKGVVTPVTWSPRMHALRLLTPKELDGLLEVEPYDDEVEESEAATLVIPLGGTFVEAELIVEPWQTDRLAALGQFSSGRLVGVGYDTVPVTSTETSDPGIAERFPQYLDALAWADRIAAISEAACKEFRGWRRMLTASGRSGPAIDAIFLAAETKSPKTVDLDTTRSLISLDDGQSLVLVVGSHEPRKNHLAVLHAAEALWAVGETFRLCFMGGNAWGNDRFRATVKRLKREGRPVVVLRRVSDAVLAAGYRLADFTVFPSIHEGFGLPIVESLSAGTPVITSDFGSMKEIADHFGGVLTIDPRSDAAIEKAIVTLLHDRQRLAELAEAAKSVHPKTWDEYADELFDYLVPESTVAQTAVA